MTDMNEYNTASDLVFFVRRDPNPVHSNRQKMVLFVAMMLIIISCDAATPKRPSSLTFYMHDTLQNGTNPSLDTSQEVAGPDHNITGIDFGRVIVFNDPLSTGPSLQTSKVIGKGQGAYIYTQVQPGIAFNAMFVFTAIIDSHDEYNGTINFMGADVILKPSRDISVVGGTGDFELARGIASISTHSIDGATFIIKAIVKLFY